MKLLPSEWYHSLTFYLLEKATGLFTNVPGPRKSVSVAGEIVDDLMFYVPALCSTTFSILSYNGYINFGVMANKGGGLNIKPQELTRLFREQFYQIHEAVIAAAAAASDEDEEDENKVHISPLPYKHKEPKSEHRKELLLLRERYLQKGKQLRAPWSSYMMSFGLFVLILTRYRLLLVLYLVAVATAYIMLCYEWVSSLLEDGVVQFPIFIIP